MTRKLVSIRKVLCFLSISQTGMVVPTLRVVTGCDGSHAGKKRKGPKPGTLPAKRFISTVSDRQNRLALTLRADLNGSRQALPHEATAAGSQDGGRVQHRPGPHLG